MSTSGTTATLSTAECLAMSEEMIKKQNEHLETNFFPIIQFWLDRECVGVGDPQL
jgi:hypothetical protein